MVITIVFLKFSYFPNDDLYFSLTLTCFQLMDRISSSLNVKTFTNLKLHNNFVLQYRSLDSDHFKLALVTLFSILPHVQNLKDNRHLFPVVFYLAQRFISLTLDLLNFVINTSSMFQHRWFSINNLTVTHPTITIELIEIFALSLLQFLLYKRVLLHLP